jgi:predicted secreted hydrolase
MIKHLNKIVISACIIIILIAYLFFNRRSNTSQNSSYEQLHNSSIEQNETPVSKIKIDNTNFIFPDDHGSHNSFKTEWWYFSGNISAEDGRKFGYELTFFRHNPNTYYKGKKNIAGPNQIYMAHFAVTDILNNQFYYKEKIARNEQDVAGATADRLKVWVLDWSVEGEYPNNNFLKPNFHLKASSNHCSIDLNLKSLKQVIPQGVNGISRKGIDTSDYSHYYSITRLATSGIIKIHGQVFNISGLSWFDREWSNSDRIINKQAWDWFSIQLDDTSDIIFYHVRDENNANNKYDYGNIILKDGKIEKLNNNDVRIDVLNYWESKIHSNYPSGWKFSIPKKNISLTILPHIKDQEVALMFDYWEGAVSVKGIFENKNISGNGYVELTGY